MDKIWISGNPATFATRGEREWKETVAQSLWEHTTFASENHSVFFDFFLRSLSPNKQPLDIDNLCEPMFSVIFGRLKWYNGNKKTLNHWAARKTVCAESGVCISGTDFSQRFMTKPVFNAIYSGPLPHNCSDSGIPNWLKESNAPLILHNKLAMMIQFGNEMINICDISTGRIKNIIDCMYPVIGGSPSSPDDWRIDYLEVKKADLDLAVDDIRITIWRIEDEDCA